MAVEKGLKWTFDTQAEKYERMRPGYVPELYEDIFTYSQIQANSNVMEIGIGGGQATLPILKTGCRLTAVEYGDKLASLCREKFKEYSNFSVITGKFEDVPFENNSYDLIFSASAFHWIPEEVGYTKVFELLKNGGVFARFANHPYRNKDNADLYEAMQNIYRVYMPNSSAPVEYEERNASDRAAIAGKYGFVDISYRLYYRTRTFTSKEYIELLGTYSDHIAIEENTGRRFFSEIEAVIDEFGGHISIYDTMDLQLARKV